MSAAASDDLAAQVTEALRQVIDPELGYNIVDLGLVYEVEAAGGIVDIVMTTTTRGCPATAYLEAGAREAARSVPGVAMVTLSLTYEPHWAPAMMTPEARQHLGFA